MWGPGQVWAAGGQCDHRDQPLVGSCPRAGPWAGEAPTWPPAPTGLARGPRRRRRHESQATDSEHTGGAAALSLQAGAASWSEVVAWGGSSMPQGPPWRAGG